MAARPVAGEATPRGISRPPAPGISRRPAHDPLPLMDNPPPVEIDTPSPFVAHIKVTPRDPPSNYKSSIAEAYVPRAVPSSVVVKRREFRLELAESRRIVPEWTGTRTLGRRMGSRGGLIGFYREIAGVGLIFPSAARPIAVDGGGMDRAMRSPRPPPPLWSRA